MCGVTLIVLFALRFAGETDIRITYEEGDDVVGISSIVGMVLGIIIFIIIATGNKRVKGQSLGFSSIVSMVFGIIMFIIIATGT